MPRLVIDPHIFTKTGTIMGQSCIIEELVAFYVDTGFKEKSL